MKALMSVDNCPKSWPVFPRIRAGASLKVVDARCGGLLRRRVFPRIRAGASLKG